MTNKERRRWARLFERCKSLSYFETRFQHCYKLRYLAEEFCKEWNTFIGDCGYPSHIRDYEIEFQRVEPTEEDMKNGVFKTNLLLHPYYMRFRVKPKFVEKALAKVYK